MDDKKILVSLIFLPVRPWFEIVISYFAFREFYYILLENEGAVEYNLAFGVYDG